MCMGITARTAFTSSRTPVQPLGCGDGVLLKRESVEPKLVSGWVARPESSKGVGFSKQVRWQYERTPFEDSEHVKIMQLRVSCQGFC